MKKMKKKTRYAAPLVTGASALPFDLICASVRMNVRVKALENINEKDGTPEEEPMYFEF